MWIVVQKETLKTDGGYEIFVPVSHPLKDKTACKKWILKRGLGATTAYIPLSVFKNSGGLTPGKNFIKSQS